MFLLHDTATTSFNRPIAVSWSITTILTTILNTSWKCLGVFVGIWLWLVAGGQIFAGGAVKKPEYTETMKGNKNWGQFIPLPTCLENSCRCWTDQFLTAPSEPIIGLEIVTACFGKLASLGVKAWQLSSARHEMDAEVDGMDVAAMRWGNWEWHQN